MSPQSPENHREIKNTSPGSLEVITLPPSRNGFTKEPNVLVPFLIQGIFLDKGWVCVCVYTYIYVSIHACMCVSVYVHAGGCSKKNEPQPLSVCICTVEQWRCSFSLWWQTDVILQPKAQSTALLSWDSWEELQPKAPGFPSSDVLFFFFSGLCLAAATASLLKGRCSDDYVVTQTRKERGTVQGPASRGEILTQVSHSLIGDGPEIFSRWCHK